MEPGPNGWNIRAALHDSGNGRPAPGFVVHAAGTGGGGATFGPVNLLDVAGDGLYSAALGQLPAGDWTLSLDVTDAPGASERAIPVKRRWPVTLYADQPLDVLGRLPAPTGSPPSDSGTPLPLILGIAAGLVGLALAGLQMARRRAGVREDVRHLAT